MDMSDKSIAFATALPVAEILTIKRDVDLIKKYIGLPNSIKNHFFLYFAPYSALVCHEAINYINKKGQEVQLEQTSKYSIETIRKKAKFFDLSFNQIMQSTANVDMLQHEWFANDMRFPELARWNVHDNLGISFDVNKNIIGNTQYAAWVYQDEDTIKKPLSEAKNFRLQNEELYNFAFDMGRVLASISDGLSAVKDFITSDVSMHEMKIYANDFNTNRCNSEGEDKYKIIQLLLLHILSSIGFILHVAKTYTIRDSGLLLRVQYIMYSAALKRFDQLKTYLQNNSTEIDDKNLLSLLSKFNFKENPLLSATFGNSMRHYGLFDKNGMPLIKEEYFNLALPLCGLVESQFNVSYFEYQLSVENALAELYKELGDYLGFNDSLSIEDDAFA